MPKQEFLSADKLISGDKASVWVAGMLVANALKLGKHAVLTTNVLGLVVLLPPSVVDPSTPSPPVEDLILDTFDEDGALGLMVKEGRNENDIFAYIQRRRARDQGEAQ